MQQMKIVVIAVSLLLVGMPTTDSAFSKYKRVESYEIRPGILIMPRYSTTRQVCEIGLQKRLYSPERVSLDPFLTRKVIMSIFDELVPLNVRGPRSKRFGEDLILEAGHTNTTTIGYENVVLEVFSARLPGQRFHTQS